MYTAITNNKYLTVKRIFDLIVASIMIVTLIPLFLAICFVLKIESPKSKVIFRQQRVGVNAHVFWICKFRSMSDEAPHEVASNDLDNKKEYITPIGRLLRKSSMDELPQLFNILAGEMSFIGPRPLILSEGEIHKEREKLGIYQIRPGITGLAQVNGRDSLNVSEKVHYDFEYLESVSLQTDVQIVVKTIKNIITHTGIIDD